MSFNQLRKLNRRRFLGACLGASQVALLGKYGLLENKAWAAPANGPTKLLTIYVPGGWQPGYFFNGFSDRILNNEDLFRERVPNKNGNSGVGPVYFNRNEIENLDGTSGSDGKYNKISVIKQWDEEALAMGNKDRGAGTAVHGWAWKQNKLYEDTCVVHGVDHETPSHDSGKIAMMCGIAGPQYRAPAMHSVVAARLYDKFKDTRPMGAVAISHGLVPNAFDLGSKGSPIQLSSLAAAGKLLSERDPFLWKGIADTREEKQIPVFDGVVAHPIQTNAIDDFVLKQTKKLAGSTTTSTDRFYESIYQMNKTLSTRLAQDIVSKIENTPGWESDYPYWARDSMNPYSSNLAGSVADSGGTWSRHFDFALRLLKSDACTALSLHANGISRATFDTHSAGGQANQYVFVRTAIEAIGRLLGEMKNTQIGGGRTLLDDTLVIISSEFARTWSLVGGSGSDHWPVTSTVFVGGGVAGNRSIGTYDFKGVITGVSGPNPAKGDLILEDGSKANRAYLARDIAWTAYHLLGVADQPTFIPGGPGQIIGVQS